MKSSQSKFLIVDSNVIKIRERTLRPFTACESDRTVSPSVCLASLFPGIDSASKEAPIYSVNSRNISDEPPSAHNTTFSLEPVVDEDTLDFLRSFSLPSDETDDMGTIDNYFYDSSPSIIPPPSIGLFDINPSLCLTAADALRTCIQLTSSRRLCDPFHINCTYDSILLPSSPIIIFREN